MRPGPAFLVCVLVLSQVAGSEGNACTDECDANSLQDQVPLRICGTDSESHLFRPDKNGPQCYQNCNVTAWYPGFCGCPSFCNNNFTQGTCSNGQCQCAKGFGGDCSLPHCPSTCSGNGTCHSGSKVFGDGLDYCTCKQTHTGPLCDAPALNVQQAPFGVLFQNDRPFYSSRDKYGDKHPIYNLSGITVIRVSMSENDFNWMMAPANMWSEHYALTNVTLHNSAVLQTVESTGMRLRGRYSRAAVFKKSFTLSFTEYQKGRRVFGIKKLILKSPLGDNTFTRNLMNIHLSRFLNIPVFRGGWGYLYVNGISMGLYWLQEDYDDEFIANHFEDDSGNCYRDDFANTYLDYVGSDPNIYKNMTRFDKGKDKYMNVYKVENGNEDFKDLTQFIEAISLNVTSNATFPTVIEKIMNVERFLRYHALEVYFCNGDSFSTNGNNWAIYNNPASGGFEWWGHDFDDSVKGHECDVYDFYYTKKNDLRAVLTARIMDVPKYKARFTEILSLLTTGLAYYNVTAYQQLEYVHDMLRPFVEGDQWYHLEYVGEDGRTVENFDSGFGYKLSFYTKRNENINGQIGGAASFAAQQWLVQRIVQDTLVPHGMAIGFAGVGVAAVLLVAAFVYDRFRRRAGGYSRV